MPIERQNSDLLGNNLMASEIASRITPKPKYSFGYKVKHSYMECQGEMAHYKAMLKSEPDKEKERRLELAKRLRHVLSKRGMKAEVARACKISEQAVSGWCRTGRIDKTHLPIIANITGSRLEWLLTGQGPMRSDETPTQEQAESLIGYLKDRVSPRSKQVLLSIQQKAADGKLTDEDLEALEIMAERLAAKHQEKPPDDSD